METLNLLLLIIYETYKKYVFVHFGLQRLLACYKSRICFTQNAKQIFYLAKRSIAIFLIVSLLFIEHSLICSLIVNTFYLNTDPLLLFFVPFVVYSDLELSKKSILKLNRGKSGVYRWTNNITGATYIGSAVDLTRRFREYFSHNYLAKEISKSNSIIYKSLLKYGYSNFTL